MQLPQFRLISFSICPYVQRPRIVMLEKQIPHTVEYIDLQQPPPWFHEVSPLEKVPVLLVDGQPLFESMPICEYLDEISPGSLYPAVPLHKAQHRAWIEFGNDVLNQHHAMVAAADERAFKRARVIWDERCQTLEEVLSEGAYFAGEGFGMVDVVYAPILRFADCLERYTGMDFITQATPRVRAWAERLLARPSVQSAVPASFEPDYRAYIRRQHGLLSQQLTATAL